MNQLAAISAQPTFDGQARPTHQISVTSTSGRVGVAYLPTALTRGEERTWRPDDLLDEGTTSLQRRLLGLSTVSQVEIDRHIDEWVADNDNPSSILPLAYALSVACARLGACDTNMSLPRYLGGIFHRPTPRPWVASFALQGPNEAQQVEVLLMPPRGDLVSALQMLKAFQVSLSRGLVDPGGLSVSPSGALWLQGGGDLFSHLARLISVMEKQGLKPGVDLQIAVDLDVHHRDEDDHSFAPAEGSSSAAEDWLTWLQRLTSTFPIAALIHPWSHDPAVHDEFVEKFPTNTQLFFRHPASEAAGAAGGAVPHRSPGQEIIPAAIGTVTSLGAVSALAHQHARDTLWTHSQGEAADPALAELAIAFGAPYIRAGGLFGAEHTIKYASLARASG